MSDLYLDEIEKIKYYKQYFAEQYTAQGLVANKENIQSALDSIDTKLSVLKQDYISSGSQMDPVRFNQQKQALYYDLIVLYRILYHLADDRVEKAKIRMRFALDDLRLKAKEFQMLTDIQAISVYGNIIYHQANNFDQEYQNGQVIIHLGQIAIPSGSYIAPLLSCDEINLNDVIFRLDESTEIPAYRSRQNYYKIVGNSQLTTEFHKNTEKEFGVGPIKTDSDISNKNKYNIFMNQNQISVYDMTNAKHSFAKKSAEIYYTAQQSEEISFYIYNATFIHFDMIGNVEYTNFSGNEILAPAMRQKIVLRGDRFSFDVKTDGQLFADKASALVSDQTLILHRAYEDIEDYTIENILYGENVVYQNVDVIIHNANSALYNINYIAIKQVQISELEDQT